MFTDYHALVISGVVRLLVGCLVLFGLLPRLLLPPMFSEEPWRRRFAGFLAAGAFVLVLVHLLVLGSMYDGLVFVTVCAGIWIARRWRSGTFGVQLGVVSLRVLEGSGWRNLLERVSGKARAIARTITLSDAVTISLLVIVIGATGVIRLVPVWNHAAPFSIEYYDVLEHAKQLQLNRMYDGSAVPLGLAALAQTLSLVSQVNIALVLHLFGAISSMLLGGAIAYVVFQATGSLRGAVVGAALFGVFNHVLPMDLRHQVEADSLVLAAAFALPALAFLTEFFSSPSRLLFVIALAGFVTAAAISLFIGFVTLGGMLLIPAAAVVYAYRLPWLRGKYLFATIAATILFLGGFLLFLSSGLDREGLRNVLEVLLYDNHLNRYFSMPNGLSPLAAVGSAALFGVVILSGLRRYPRASMGLQLVSWGTLGGIALLVARFSGGEIWILQFSQVAFVLSVLLAVACGSVVGVGMEGASQLFGRLRHGEAVPKLAGAIVLIGVLVALGAYSPARGVGFEYTAEPDGFATSIYLIEQRYTPYQWTVVSHRGTALVGMNRGRFLDYDYFCKQYDPATYSQGGVGTVPTPVVFFFVERFHEKTEIATELTTVNRNAEVAMKQWLVDYEQHHHDLRVFYSDEDVVVYELKDPIINALRG